MYGLFLTATSATLQQNWWERTGIESLEIPMDTGFCTLSGVSDRGVFLLQCYSCYSSFLGQKHPFWGKNSQFSYKNALFWLIFCLFFFAKK